MHVRIYHYPRCGKSREALKLLEAKGFSPEIRLYQKEPPTLEELQALHQLLGGKVREMMRTKDTLYKEAALDDQGLVEETLLRAIVQRPALLERPIVVVDDAKAVIARPAERMEEILGE